MNKHVTVKAQRNVHSIKKSHSSKTDTFLTLLRIKTLNLTDVKILPLPG